MVSRGSIRHRVKAQEAPRFSLCTPRRRRRRRLDTCLKLFRRAPMPESEARTGTEILNLGEDFPPVATATWEAAIQKDLKGADYEKKLVWRSDEGVEVRPYYRSEN